jgi:hypothetical protein
MFRYHRTDSRGIFRMNHLTSLTEQLFNLRQGKAQDLGPAVTQLHLTSHEDQSQKPSLLPSSTRFSCSHSPESPFRGPHLFKSPHQQAGSLFDFPVHVRHQAVIDDQLAKAVAVDDQ